MKNFINNNVVPFLIITAIIGGLGAFGYFCITGVKTEFAKEPIEVGSVNIANEYHATTTVLITGTTYKGAQTRHLIQTGITTLGSVVIASTTQNVMAIYNATSSEAVVDGTYGTLITTFPAGAPQGTYTFDIVLGDGLVLDLASGFGGDFVVTFR